MGFYKKLATHDQLGTVPTDRIEKYIYHALNKYKVNAVEDLPEKQIKWIEKQLNK